MAEKNPINPVNDKDRLYRFGVMFFLVLSFFFVVLSLKTIKEYTYVGYGPASPGVITVSGQGESFAVPDVAFFTFDVHATGKTVPEAQDKATKGMESSLKVLKDAGIDDKDIKTIGYYMNPQYDYTDQRPLMCTNGYCPPAGNPVLIGYEVTQTVEVKVRESSKVGSVVSNVGAAGATGVSGVDFRVDDDSTVQEEARNKAIADAKMKAKRQAAALGVHLVRVLSFNESYGPMYYKAETMAMDSRGGIGGTAPAAVPLPQGENKYTADVQITYEIR